MNRNPSFVQDADRVQEFVRPTKQLRGSASINRFGRNQEILNQEKIKLVQNVFRVNGMGGPHVVVFAGVEHGNGCSTICTRAAETLSVQNPGSVCVVDANLRSPALHRYFGVDNLRGFTDMVLLSGPIQDFAQRVAGEKNLWLLTCGFHTLDPQAVLTSDRLRSRITELRGVFDYVLIDAPPANLYTDAALLGQLADGLILVVEAESTRRETTQKSKEGLESANVKLLGAVLNKRRFPIPESLYRKL
jgi:capsular exopolysaccharide synthesis family protein